MSDERGASPWRDLLDAVCTLRFGWAYLDIRQGELNEAEFVPWSSPAGLASPHSRPAEPPDPRVAREWRRIEDAFRRGRVTGRIVLFVHERIPVRGGTIDPALKIFARLLAREITAELAALRRDPREADRRPGEGGA